MSKRKVLTFLAGILAVPIVSGASVSAVDSNCTISNTGPGSNNTCTVSGEYTCTVENNTVIIVDSNNQQVATSGDANNSGNTGSGGSTSGSATNSNGTTFNFTITNGEDEESPAVCTVSTVTTPAPEPEQPVGGSGAAGAGEVVAAATPRPTVLAKTSGDNLSLYAGIIAAVALVAASVRGVALLRSRL